MDAQTLSALLTALLGVVTAGFGILFRALLAAQSGRIERAEKVADDQAPTIARLTVTVEKSSQEYAQELRTLTRAFDALAEEVRRGRGRG